MNIAEKIEQISGQMISHNYRFTKQRENVARALLEHEFPRPSAEEVFHHLKRLSSKTARATVYRTLELLAEIDILVKINMDDGVTRFCFRGDECNHMNHYLLCATCGNVEELQEDWLSEVEKRVEQEYGFQVIDHLLVFKGIREAGLHTGINSSSSRVHCSCT